jgi:hypothetical protein
MAGTRKVDITSNTNAAPVIPHPDQAKQDKQVHPTQQGNDGRPNPSSHKNPADAQQDVTPNTPPKPQSTGKVYDTRYHDGREPDPSKI